MRRTTLYLPDDLKRALERLAARRGVSEAEVIRTAVAKEVGADRPRPHGGLFRGDKSITNDVDSHLAGFGQD